MTFRVGDRVRVKADCADGFVQPWRNRFKNGRHGTVISIRETGVMQRFRVQFDYGPRGKDYDFRLDMRPQDIELATSEASDD